MNILKKKAKGDKSFHPNLMDNPKKEVLASVGQSKPNLICDGSKKCKRVFRSGNNLVNHKLSWHPEIKTHTCLPCQKMFENKSSLYQHIKRFHKGVLETDLTCKECGKLLATKEKLKSHKRQEHEAGYCLKCGKVFISGTKLRCHRSSCLKNKIIKSKSNIMG